MIRLHSSRGCCDLMAKLQCRYAGAALHSGCPVTLHGGNMKNMPAKQIAMNTSIIIGPGNIQGAGPQPLHHHMAFSPYLADSPLLLKLWTESAQRVTHLRSRGPPVPHKSPSHARLRPRQGAAWSPPK